MDKHIFRIWLLILNNDFYMDNSLEFISANREKTENLVVDLTKVESKEFNNSPIMSIQECLYRQIDDFDVIIIKL